jgi:hypothetical protein
MKVEFWLTLVPKYGRGDKITKVVADKITKTRPTRGHGVAVKVSLDVSESLFHPLRVEGEFGSETETVVLNSESVAEDDAQEFQSVRSTFCLDCASLAHTGLGDSVACLAEPGQFEKCVAGWRKGAEYGPVE